MGSMEADFPGLDASSAWATLTEPPALVSANSYRLGEPAGRRPIALVGEAGHHQGRNRLGGREHRGQGPVVEGAGHAPVGVAAHQVDHQPRLSSGQQAPPSRPCSKCAVKARRTASKRGRRSRRSRRDRSWRPLGRLEHFNQAAAIMALRRSAKRRMAIAGGAFDQMVGEGGDRDHADEQQEPQGRRQHLADAEQLCIRLVATSSQGKQTM